jgi:hypothetical protein
MNHINIVIGTDDGDGGSCKMTSSILRKTTLFAKDIYLRERGVISPCPNHFYRVCYALSILYLPSLLACYKDKYGFYNNIIFFIPLNGRWRRWWAYHHIINLMFSVQCITNPIKMVRTRAYNSPFPQINVFCK